MPFIGTRNMYRRQGMCRRLLNAIESALCSVDVEKLVIPAISELFQTWTSVFGFKLLESKRKTTRHMSMIVFPGTDMLEKPLSKHQVAEGHMILAADLKSTELGTKPQTLHVEANVSDRGCFIGSDSSASPEAIVQHASGVHGEPAACKSGLHHPDGSLHNQLVKDSTCDAPEIGQQTPEGMNRCPNVPSSSVLVLPDIETGERNPNLAQHDICGVEIKPSIVPQIGSDAMNCARETTHALEGGKDAGDFLQNTDVNSSKPNCGSLEGGSIQHPAGIMNQRHDAELHEFQASDSGDTLLMSSDAKYEIQLHRDSHTTSPSLGRTEDVAEDSDIPLPDGNSQNCPCLVNVSKTHEPQDFASVDNKQLPFSGTVLYATAGFDSPASYMDPGSCKSSETGLGVDNGNISGVRASSLTCPVGVNQTSLVEVARNDVQELKEQFAASQADFYSVGVNSLSKGSKLCSKSSEQPESCSQVDHTSVTLCDSESLSISSSCPDLVGLCTSGSRNLFGISEVGSCRLLKSGKLC
ncbi:unnamed protein product [Ilex paraguariensis]